MNDRTDCSVKAIDLAPLPPKRRRVGRCIYCGRSDVKLSDEHVIPYALNGDLVLEEASCEQHAAVTSAIEREVCREQLGKLRAVARLKTRRPNLRPKTLPVEMKLDGVFQAASVDATDHSGAFILPVFPEPGQISGRHYDDGRIDITNVTAFRRVLSGWLSQQNTRLRESLGCKPANFARFIAKIAYGAAVFFYGLEGLDSSFLVPAICGTSGDVSRWVGCLPRPPRNPANDVDLHRVSSNVTNRVLYIFVRLFCPAGTPEYVAIVGTRRS